MPRILTLALSMAILLAAAPYTAEAYIGPGAGIGAIGTIIALIGAILLAIIGFIWYPIKRIWRKRSLKEKMANDTSETYHS